MALPSTVPKDFRLTLEDTQGANSIEPSQTRKHHSCGDWTTEILQSPLTPPKTEIEHSETKERRSLKKPAPKTTKLFRNLQQSFKRKDPVQKALEKDWVRVECDKSESSKLREAIENAQNSFHYSTSTTDKQLATSLFKRSQAIIDGHDTLNEKVQMVFSHCSDEITSLTNHLERIRESLQANTGSRNTQDKTSKRRIEWTVTRMEAALDSIQKELDDCLKEQDLMIRSCGQVIVHVMALLQMRTHTADYSTTGVAAGAAGIVAGAVVGTAALLAAPASGGLTVPLAFAGKGLFVSGAAAMTPSSIMLQRHTTQLDCLAVLIRRLQSRLDIMNQKRSLLSSASFACVEASMNVQHVNGFCNDALELEVSMLPSVSVFADAIHQGLKRLQLNSTTFLYHPSLFHHCYEEDHEFTLTKLKAHEE